MEHDVVIKKGLLDKEQVQVIQGLQALPVLHGVGGIGIDLEEDVRKTLTYCPGDLIVEPGPDLDFESAVAKRNRVLGEVEHRGDGLATDAYADGERAALSAPDSPQRLSAPLGDDIPHRGFNTALGEDRTLHPGIAVAQRIDICDRTLLPLPSADARQDELTQGGEDCRSIDLGLVGGVE